MDGTTNRHMCVVYDIKVHRTFSLLKWGIIVHRGLYTYYFHRCPDVVKLSWPIAFKIWRLSTGSILAVAVTSCVLPLTLPDVRIFRQFRSLPKRQQPKRRTNEKDRKWWGAQCRDAFAWGTATLFASGNAVFPLFGFRHFWIFAFAFVSVRPSWTDVSNINAWREYISSDVICR